MSDFPSWAIMREFVHTSHLFPEDSDEFVTFAAGAPDNAFGAWAEIVDNNSVTFSSKAANHDIHISSVQIESADTKDAIYRLEIAYGATKTSVASHRFASGDLVKLPAIQQIRLRPDAIPAGETIYYQMKCETAGAICTASIRYHWH